MKIGGAMVVASVLAGLAGCASAPPKPAGGVPPPAVVTANHEPVPEAADAVATKSGPVAEPVPTPRRVTAPAAPAIGDEREKEAATVVTPPSETATLPSGHYAIMVESQPSGATVVIDGIPVGRSPRRVVVPGTSMGFFRDAISIKVRFLATDAQSMSQTVEEQLTPRDRIPAALMFTPGGARRQLR